MRRGQKEGLGDRSPSVRSRGKAPVGGLEDEVPQQTEVILHFDSEF